jgi:hypothetical protein
MKRLEHVLLKLLVSAALAAWLVLALAACALAWWWEAIRWEKK